MREEVEGLEDDPDAPPHRVYVDVPARDLLAVQEDRACVDPLEQVDAPKQRRLAGAGGPDQADDLVLADVEIDAAEHLEGAERLVHAFEPQRRGARTHRVAPAL